MRDKTLLGISTPGQSGPGSDGNEGVLCIPQSSSITGASLSDCVMSLPACSLGESYPSAEMQSEYSTAPADWANKVSIVKLVTLVEDYSKAPFSIATTPRCKGGRYSFPWIALLYPSSLSYNAEC